MRNYIRQNDDDKDAVSIPTACQTTNSDSSLMPLENVSDSMFHACTIVPGPHNM